jgi:hypothetical protein
MPLDDRIRSAADIALADLAARWDQDLRAVVAQLVTEALEGCDEALAAARRDIHEQATADAERQLALAEARVRATMDEAVRNARTEERAKAAGEMQHLIEAEMAALTRLLESVRGLDGATSLSDVLNVLGDSAGREAARAAVLVVKNERLIGWRLCGFGAPDAQPKAIDMNLNDSGVVARAVATGRPAASAAGEGASGPGFAPLPPDRMGLAVPVIVGGRVVAVVYADSGTTEGREQAVPSGWPEAIEMLARHASRCLEALTVQKTARQQSPRFWVPGGGRQNVTSGAAPTTRVAQTASTQTTSTRGPEELAPPGVMT